MEPDYTESDVVGPEGGDLWFASKGFDKDGRSTHINFFVKDESEVQALAHGLGIASGISMHSKAKRIGNRRD